MCADSFKFVFAEEILYTLTLVAVKISILPLYQSIFFVGWAFAIVVNVTSVFVVDGALALILVSIFTCKPIYANWDMKVPSTCFNSSLFYILSPQQPTYARMCSFYFFQSGMSGNCKCHWTEIPSLRSVPAWRIVSILLLNEASLILTELSVYISSDIRLYILLSFNVNDHAESSCQYRIRPN